MNLKLLTIKYAPLLNWALRGIPRGTYGVYMLWKKENPEVNEKQLAIALFNRRFKSTVLESSRQERARIKSYFGTYPEPETLIDMCVATAMVEFKVPANDKETFKYISQIISVELFKLGYRKQQQ